MVPAKAQRVYMRSRACVAVELAIIVLLMFSQILKLFLCEFQL